MFAASHFGYSDTDGDALASVKITGLPAAGKGTLTLDGTAITGSALPQTVTAVELADDKLIYTPPANAFGTPYTTFNFKVNDGTVDSAEYTVTINITSSEDPGTVSIMGTLLGGSTLTASLSDPDGNVTNASWRWMRGDTDAGTFSNISGATAATYDLVAADVGKYLKARVSYTDGDGSGKSATSDPSGPVVASNAEPAFSSATATRTLPENSGAGTDVVGGTITATDTDGDTLIYGLKNTGDHASFTIVSSSGQIQAKTGITYNFEGSKKTYTVTVTVHDGKDLAGGASTVVDDEIVVTINLTDENEAPTITGGPTSRSVPENSTAVATYTASDVDASDTLRWSVESAGDGSFFEISSGGVLTFTNAPNFEDKQDANADNVYNVTVSVSDTGGMSATRAVAVTVTNINEAPEITTDSAMYTAFNVDENTATAVVIKTYAASDVDAGSVLTWTLEGDDRLDFTITTNTQGQGELKFANVPNYEMPADADTMNDYDVTVKVRDNHTGQLSDTLTVSVTVDDVNEAPVITSPPATRSIPENSTAVATFSATDVDASGTLTWSVESADDGGKFTIDPSSGVLTFTNAPDFETPTDTGDTAMNNTYVLTVKVEDDGSPAMSDTHTVTVTVTNINEAPEITTDSATYTAFNVDENTATSVVIKTYAASDVDAGSVLTWTLEGDDRLDFTITKNAQGQGELKFASVPNYEMAADDDGMNDYDVTVKVRDNHTGQLSDTLTVTVTVDDVNETPEVSGNAGPSFMEIEFDVLNADLTPMDYEIGTYTAYDDDADTVAWSVSGTDSTHFAIDPTTGVLSFSIRPDFENPVAASGNNYVVVVEADDGQGGVGTFDVTVTVTQVNETPEITSNNATQTFDEIEYDATTADLEVDTFTGRDEETETITWSLVGTDAGDFSINSASGLLSFSRRPNYEMPADNGMDNVYDITVRARDTDNNTRDYPVTVTVMDENERPDIDEDTVPSYVEIEYDFTGTRPGVHTFTATDYDAGDTFTWTVAGTDAEHLEIDPSSGALTFTQDLSFGRGPLPNYEYPRDGSAGGSNTYSITVVATDSQMEATEYAVTITVTDVNEAPEFTESPALSVDVDEHDVNGEYVVMDLADYDARDEEGGVTWSLTGTDSGDFAISADGVVTFRATPNFEAPADSGGNNVYNVTVVARDTASGSTRRTVSADVTVTVMDVEEAGKIEVVNLNLDPVVGETVTFMLSDPDGGISSIEWRVQLRDHDPDPDVGWASEPSDGSNATTFRYLVDEDHAGKEMRAYVEYSDLRGSGKLATSQGTAAITASALANAKPRFRDRSTRAMPEGGAGRDVGAPVAATDRDGDTLTFGIQEGESSEYFAINPSTGQIRTTQALDFETTPGLKFLFLTVTLHDGKGVDLNNMVIADDSVDTTATIAIIITDVEEDGVVTFSSVEPEVGTPLQATLADGDGSVSGEMWQWARSENGRTGWTNISGGTGATYTPTEADEDFYLRASVTYADRRGGGKSAEAVTSGPVPSENRRPLFLSTEDGQRTVAENTRAGVNIGAPVAAVDPENDRLTYSLSGTDAGAFTIITSTGQLRTKEALDFETQSTYSVIVEVHDGRDGSGNPSTIVDDTQDVTITIENVEEQGVVTLTTLTGVIQARVVVTAELEDDDRPTGVNWQWSQSPNGRTDWVNIGTGDTYTPTLDDAGKYIRATASYADGHGSNKTALKVSPRVGEPPPVNSPPVFPPSENGQREVAENASGGTSIGDPVGATDVNAGDPDVNDPLAYALSGTDAASFEIDASAGQLRVASGVQLDFEGKRSYRVTVQVTDGRDRNGDDDMGAIDDTIAVTITVTDVNEAPVVTGEAAPSFQENANTAVASYTAADPERDTLTWSVSGNDFWISDRGQLYFATPPSYESGRTSYTVTITAADDDATPLSGSHAVTVTLTDAEEEGTVVITPPRDWVGMSITADLTDDDGGISGESWQWARSSNRSNWTDIPNASSESYTATPDDVGNYLRASVTYSDRRSSNKTASAVLATRVGDVTPATNAAPTFVEDQVTRSIGQGTAAGRIIGAPVRTTDPDSDDILTYSLSGADADDFDIDPATGQLRTKAVLDYDPQGQNAYEVTVQVHDGFDSVYSPSSSVDASVDVTITVTAVVQRVGGGGGGGGGSGGSGGGGGGGGSGGSGGGGSSGGGGGAPSNQSPQFTDGSRTDRSIPESTPAGADIGEPVAARDSENDKLTYALRGADAKSFDIDPATGQLLTKAPLDYEATSAYSVIVSVSDGKSSSGRDSDSRDDSITVTINVENADEPGAVALSSHRPQVDVALTATLTDPDGGLARVVWLWERSADQADWTEIDGAASNSYTPVVGDLGSYLRATASYEDGHGLGKSAGAVTGDPVLINTVPRFPSPAITIEVEEGSGDAESGGAGEPVAAADPDGDTLTYSLSGADADAFEIDASTGQLWSKAPLDYETQANYTVVVSVRDSRDFNEDPDTAVDAEVTVTINVENADEPGAVALSSHQPQVDVALTAMLTDPDGVVGEVVWKWERSRDGNPWSSSWRAIGGAESAAYAPVEADVGYYLRVTASYEDGHGPDKSRQAISEGRVEEFTGPVFSDAPDGVLERSVEENTGEGEAVGAPVAATSPDGGALTYALGGADAALFAIDADTGQIRVGAGTALDYEADENVYEVTVTATDSSGASATVAVTVTVTDVDLPGVANDYDADDNESIDRDEALAAVVDYFAERISKEEAIEIVQLYFAG